MSERETKNVGIHGIAIPITRMRRLRPEIISQLKDSMRVNGLISPITVRLKEESNWQCGYILVAGLHRLEAARELKWESIQATVVSGLDADKATLIEIDENLVRGDLTPIEHDMHLAARSEIWERLNGSPKAVGARATNAKLGRGMKDATLKNPVAFTIDTAKKTGQNPSTVRNGVARGKKAQATPNIAKAIGTSLDKSVELDALVDLPVNVQQDLINRAANGEKVSAKTEKKKIDRKEKETALAVKQAALPDQRYGVILADPEWKFDTWSENGKDRSAENHYPCSDTGAIVDRKVGDLAADDCVLFLWATVPMMPQALDVMRAWGFEYKSHCIWQKDRVGTGYWFRNKHELLLVGTRGDVPAPAAGTQFPSVIESPVGAHSAKPEVFLELIESYFPTLSKIELNRRGAPRAGWDGWGLECEAAE